MTFFQVFLGAALASSMVAGCAVGEVPSEEGPLNSPAGSVEPVGCGVEALAGGLPALLEFNTAGAGDDFELPCSVGTSSGDEDVAYRFKSPARAYYAFEVFDANFDAVLGVTEPLCEGVSRRCNDEASHPGVESRVVMPLREGSVVLVVVDGYQSGEIGRGRLRVEAVEVLCEDGLDGDGDGVADCQDPDCGAAPHCAGGECPALELQGLPVEVEGLLEGAGALGDASCSNGGNQSPERAYGFVAPATGAYRFHTRGSSMDTVLYVREEFCTGRELGCDDDGGGEKASYLKVDLVAGQRVVVVVDGWDSEGGQFRLTVEAAEWDCGDGLDNDGDGAIDCADQDCVSEACGSTGEWPADWTTREEEMLVEVNLRRVAGATCDQEVFGPVPPLVMEPALRLSARLHSLEMATQDYFEHEGMDGSSPDERMRAAGFSGEYPTGENISGGYGTARSSVEGLMNSPGHCRNIMDPEYRVAGMGYVFEGASSLLDYWTQNFGGSL